MTDESRAKKQASTQSEIGSDEAGLIWDEYKYRHDLIWRHLIRSTVAVVALVTVSYSTSFQDDQNLFVIAALIAVMYTIFNIFVVKSELRLFEKIKVVHRERQNDRYGMHIEDQELDAELIGKFSRRVRLYLWGLLVLAVAAAVSHL